MNGTVAFGSGTISDWTFFYTDPSDSVAGNTLIAFDPTSSVVGGVTQGIYASVYGTGVFHSTNAGATWTLTSSGPANHRHMIVDPFGNVWLTADNGGTSNLWEYASGTWSSYDFSSQNFASLDTVAYNPASCSTSATCYIITATNDGAQQAISLNGGSTWISNFNETYVLSALDIPWLALTGFPSNGDQQIDSNGLVWWSMGAGVFTFPPPTSRSHVTFTSASAAIEELVGRMVISPPSGNPVLLAEDFSTWYVSNSNAYPSTYGPAASGVIEATSIDYASGVPNLVGVIATNFSNYEDSSISTDGGQTWAAFPGKPSEATGGSYAGGQIAMSDTGKYLWAVGGGGHLYCGDGTTWHQQTIGTTGNTGWTYAYYLFSKIIAADRVNSGTFYAYNTANTGGSNQPGVWVTTDNCTTWTLAKSGYINSSFDVFNVKLKTVPGNAGNFYFTSGPVNPPHPASQSFYECTTSFSGSPSTSCSAVSNVKEVWDFDFGKAKIGGSGYPCIYIYGWVNQGSGYVAGDWQSCDHAVTWVQAPQDNNGLPLSLDTPNGIGADINNYGVMYRAMGGSGFQTLRFNYLLNRDLNPANDNSPVGLPHVA